MHPGGFLGKIGGLHRLGLKTPPLAYVNTPRVDPMPKAVHYPMPAYVLYTHTAQEDCR